MQYPQDLNHDEFVAWCSNYGWKSSGGTVVYLKDMSWNHLANILKFPDAHPNASQNTKNTFIGVRPVIYIEMLRRQAENLSKKGTKIG